MKRITAFAALLVLSLAPALQAQGGDWGRDRYRYPSSGQWERVAALAHELEDTATYIHRHFERNNRRPNRAEARVAADLHELNEQATHLHRQFEGRGYDDRNDHGYRQDSRYRDDSFARLEEAFFNLSDSLRYIQPRPYVDSGMDRIYSLMNEIGRYSGRSGHDRSYRGWNRFDGRHGGDRFDRNRLGQRDHDDEDDDHDHDD
jgi:hypothetical protein